MTTVLTNWARGWIAQLLNGVGTAHAKYIGWGTGATTPVVTGTTISTEVTDTARATGTESIITTTVTNDTYKVVGTITATTTRAITNAGLFDAVSSGNLAVWGDHSTVNLATGDSITYTFTIQIL